VLEASDLDVAGLDASGLDVAVLDGEPNRGMLLNRASTEATLFGMSLAGASSLTVASPASGARPVRASEVAPVPLPLGTPRRCAFPPDAPPVRAPLDAPPVCVAPPDAGCPGSPYRRSP
jgi:hypothetical protein